MADDGLAIVAVVRAIVRLKRAVDVLMPGIGGLAIAARDLENINLACIEADMIISEAKQAGLVVVLANDGP